MERREKKNEDERILVVVEAGGEKSGYVDGMGDVRRILFRFDI